MYLASPQEIADIMNSTACGRGDTILYENHTWSTRAQGNGTTDRIPDEWKFTAHRVKDIFNKFGK